MTIRAINVKNQFIGKIRRIVTGPVLSEVEVDTYTGIIVTSVISTSSLEDLGFQVGQEVLTAVKALEVSIATL